MQKTFVSSLARMALVPALAALSVPAAAQLPAPRRLAVNAGPLGVLQASGWVSGAALTANPQPAGGTSGTNLTNAFVILQKPSGEWRFYLQAGVYSLPALGAQRKSTSAYTGLFGPVPQAYGEWRPDARWNLQAGPFPPPPGQGGPFTSSPF